MKKPTLLVIRRGCAGAINSQMIAQRTGLSIGEVFSVEVGGYCRSDTVQQVLTAYNAATGQHLTINDIFFRASSQ